MCNRRVLCHWHNYFRKPSVALCCGLQSTHQFGCFLQTNLPTIFAPHGRAWHPSAGCQVMVNTFSTLYMFGSGILTEERLSRHRDALIAHLKPDTLLIDKLLIKARGQNKADQPQQITTLCKGLERPSLTVPTSTMGPFSTDPVGVASPTGERRGLPQTPFFYSPITTREPAHYRAPACRQVPRRERTE